MQCKDCNSRMKNSSDGESTNKGYIERLVCPKCSKLCTVEYREKGSGRNKIVERINSEWDI